jgi:ArsR family transcriptional regulator, arsenate/arsenite/antimonite-responsive transcriptional repressor
MALERLFKALADRTRLRILALLAVGEVCVCDLHDSLGEPQPKVSRHLAYLRRAGLVSARKDGLWVHYRRAELEDPVLETVANSAIHAVGHLRTSERDQKKLSERIPGRPPATILTQCGPGCCSR